MLLHHSIEATVEHQYNNYTHPGKDDPQIYFTPVGL